MLRLRHCARLIARRFASNIAVVGSGPSGFYTAHDLLKQGFSVSMFERLPVPYGLSRFGVAPDHPEVKNCEETFAASAKNPAFTFYGNTNVGVDVELEELYERFNGVVLSYGCTEPNELGIEGEHEPGVMSALDFVSWYNGDPLRGQEPPLDRVKDVVIVGNGNVAMDIARLLLKPVDDLIHTDITERAIEVFQRSTVKRVRIVARRGFMESAFTTKEIRELLQLEQHGVKFEGIDDKVIEILLPIKNKLERVQKRKLETLLEYMKPLKERKKTKYVIPETFTKSWKLDYLLSPVEIRHENGLSSEIILRENMLIQDTPTSPVKMQPIMDSVKAMKSDLVITSLGFKGKPIAGLDTIGGVFERGAIKNIESRAIDSQGNTITGLYVAGWIKNFRKGPIVNALVDSAAVTKAVVEDKLDARHVRGVEGLSLPNATSWSHWEKLNEFELEKGKAEGKLRSKVTSVDEMLAIMRS